MATSYAPLTLGLIEEGRFEEEFANEFADIQRKLCAYVVKYGDRAANAQAEIAMRIVMKVKDVEDQTFGVKASIAVKLPQRPSRMTLALMEKDDDDGELCLFSRKSGTTEDTPRQTVLCTEDGQAVDVRTGEIKGGAR